MKTMKRFAIVSLSVFALSFSVYPACTGVSTFECIGIYYDKSGGGAECTPLYKAASAGEWKTGHPLLWDAQDAQYRGSLVNLTPGTVYDIQLKIGGSVEATLQCTTWSENFPLGQTIYVSNQSTMLNITQSGTPQGYTLYMPSPGQQAVIDLNNTQSYCVNVNADYVIIRGLKLTGAKFHGVLINGNRHDVVIENCEITNWGPSGVGNFDWEEGSGIRAYNGSYRIVAQNNIIHTPRGGSWYWDEEPSHNHPWGPQAFGYEESDGNNVIRYNYCYSESAHYFNDGIGGGSNGGAGNIHKDSDVYGNIVSHCWDDGLEIEGYNINCRIWGNIIHHSYMAIATVSSSQQGKGPCYIWRNLIFNGYMKYNNYKGDASAFKCAYDTPLYVYHNTTLLSVPDLIGPLPNAVQNTTNLYNYTCKNNILDAIRGITGVSAIGSGCFFDYNLYRQTPPSVEGLHGIKATPVYEKVSQYNYFLKDCPGIDHAVVIPNFNDNYVGGGPDIGVFETGGDTLKFGPQGGVITGIIGERGFIKLLPYSLQTFPNPFFHSTTIQFESGSHGKNQIEIYSMSGQLLFSSSAGKSDVMWNGLDRLGMPVAPGQYLVRIKTSDQSLQKMITKVR